MNCIRVTKNPVLEYDNDDTIRMLECYISEGSSYVPWSNESDISDHHVTGISEESILSHHSYDSDHMNRIVPVDRFFIERNDKMREMKEKNLTYEDKALIELYKLQRISGSPIGNFDKTIEWFGSHASRLIGGGEMNILRHYRFLRNTSDMMIRYVAFV